MSLLPCFTPQKPRPTSAKSIDQLELSDNVQGCSYALVRLYAKYQYTVITISFGLALMALHATEPHSMWEPGCRVAILRLRSLITPRNFGNDLIAMTKPANMSDGHGPWLSSSSLPAIPFLRNLGVTKSYLRITGPSQIGAAQQVARRRFKHLTFSNFASLRWFSQHLKRDRTGRWAKHRQLDARSALLASLSDQADNLRVNIGVDSPFLCSFDHTHRLFEVSNLITRINDTGKTCWDYVEKCTNHRQYDDGIGHFI